MNPSTQKLTRSPQDRLTDQAFMQSITVSILSILLCLAALTATTWAWFEEAVSSSHNTITSHMYTEYVAVKVIDQAQSEVPLSSDGSYTLVANQNYTVTLTSSGRAKEGYYCRVIGNDKEVLTEQMSAHDDTVSFILSFSEDTCLRILPCWGNPQVGRTLSDGQFYTGSFQLTATHIVSSQNIAPVPDDVPPPPVENSEPISIVDPNVPREDAFLTPDPPSTDNSLDPDTEREVHSDISDREEADFSTEKELSAYAPVVLPPAADDEEHIDSYSEYRYTK